ncbi:endonuclease [Dyadobacter subterraneus]|uniref:Endonuclease n=1 Tax=Dyadobacter subterraneus TaxID=2773304 RepID=A0ABR9WEL3_9BACT|nr:endonuclease [Dyadobacter subterraneus]MBE9463935.1 endonuclease [Dyadobacter subterraneus]
MKMTEAGAFTVITYNIAGLPEFISSAVTKRSSSIAEIGEKLNGFDIAHVQEDFNYNKYLYNSGNKHPFRTKNKGKVPFGDGLNTLSRFPVHDLQRIRWKDCSGTDCLTPKGFSFSRIEVAKDVFIDFYNVHANAWNHNSASAARRKNITQLSDFIKLNSSENAVIVMGDLNARYCFFNDNISLLNTENGLTDVWVSEKNEGKFPDLLKDFPSEDILSITDSCETVDKILFKSSKDLDLKVTDYKFENLLFSNKEGLPLSDHIPVSARFHWNIHRNVRKGIETILTKNEK